MFPLNDRAKPIVCHHHGGATGGATWGAILLTFLTMKGATRGALFLTLLVLRYFRPNAQECKKYDNHPNQVMWVFIEKLSLSTVR